METLISMTDFVIAMREDKDKDNIRSFWSSEKYARFLKQPLQLWMFVPCDKDGNVLGEKKPFQDKYYEYQQAKERCLFGGFEIFEMDEDNFIYLKCLINGINSQLIFDLETKVVLLDNNRLNDYLHTIEDIVKYNLKLTDTAQKHIGL